MNHVIFDHLRARKPIILVLFFCHELQPYQSSLISTLALEVSVVGKNRDYILDWLLLVLKSDFQHKFITRRITIQMVSIFEGKFCIKINLVSLDFNQEWVQFTTTNLPTYNISFLSIYLGHPI